MRLCSKYDRQMGHSYMSSRCAIVAALIIGLGLTSCATGDDNTSKGDTARSDKGTSSDVEMPSGRYTGEWPDNPPDFANNHLATGSFELITVDVSGNSWTVSTSYSTTIPVGGGCFSTMTHTISGNGEIMVDAGGANLMGEVPDRWLRERDGDGCPGDPSETGESEASVFLNYKDGMLDGWIEGHDITLTNG